MKEGTVVDINVTICLIHNHTQMISLAPYFHSPVIGKTSRGQRKKALWHAYHIRNLSKKFITDQFLKLQAVNNEILLNFKI